MGRDYLSSILHCFHDGELGYLKNEATYFQVAFKKRNIVCLA